MWITRRRVLPQFALRRRNTRYKNPQLVAQNCFVASFRRCFPFFTMRDKLYPEQKYCCGLKKCGALIGWYAREPANFCATSCEFDEKRARKPKFVAQSIPALYFSQQLSWTRNKCFCCATSWSHKVKNGKHQEKLATKQCCATSLGFLYLVCFAAFIFFMRLFTKKVAFIVGIFYPLPTIWEQLQIVFLRSTWPILATFALQEQFLLLWWF